MKNLICTQDALDGMNAMKTEKTVEMLKKFMSEQDAVTAIEYALLAALIFGAIVVSVGLLGDNVQALYDDIAAKVAGAMP